MTPLAFALFSKDQHQSNNQHTRAARAIALLLQIRIKARANHAKSKMRAEGVLAFCWLACLLISSSTRLQALIDEALCI